MKSMGNQFWKFVIPSMITVLLGGTFAFVDGIFIGQGTGDLGLTAVNLVTPVAALVTALAAGIGMGGSILMSTYAGNGEKENVQKARGATIITLAAVSLILFLAGGLFSKQIVDLLGAKGTVFAPAFDYLKIVLTFGCFQIFSSGLSSLIINSGKSALAMAVMVGALVVNIILDGAFVLVFDMGTLGAALATVIGQALSAVVYTMILLKDESTRPQVEYLKPEKELLKKVVKIGLSPFGVQLAPSIVVMCVNYACVWTGGKTTLAAFAVMNQLILAIQILFTGIGNGIQPIISYCTGANNDKAVHKVFRKAMVFMLCVASFLIIGIYAVRFHIPRLFNASDEVAITVRHVLIYLFLMIPFTGFNRVLVPFFFASTQCKKANLLTYLEPLAVTPFFLLVCCWWKGPDGVWAAMLLVQVALSAVGYWLLKQSLARQESRLMMRENIKTKTKSG